MNSVLEQQTFNLQPDRWTELYRDQLMASLGIANEEGEIPLTEDDLDELDRFMEKLESNGRFTMNGGDATQYRSEWSGWT